jgi:hypothetical protein
MDIDFSYDLYYEIYLYRPTCFIIGCIWPGLHQVADRIIKLRMIQSFCMMTMITVGILILHFEGFEKEMFSEQTDLTLNTESVHQTFLTNL